MTQDVRLRPADEAECRAGGWPSGAVALEHSIANSTRAYSIIAPEGSEVLCYWGWRELSVLGGGCVAWMLSTPALDDHRMFAARQSLRLRDYLLATYGDVYVGVDTEYSVAVRWLRWLGFRPFFDFGRFQQLRATRKGLVN